VVESAKAAGLSIISVCDHNTIGVYERLYSICKSHKIKLVLGIEFDVDWEGNGIVEVHRLLYGGMDIPKYMQE